MADQMILVIHHHIFLVLSDGSNVLIDDLTDDRHAPEFFILVKLRPLAERLTALKDKEHQVVQADPPRGLFVVKFPLIEEIVEVL